MSTSYNSFHQYKVSPRKIADINYASALLQWDQETYLPPKGGDMCSYIPNFNKLYPSLNQISVNDIFNRHNTFCR